jgi:hypothetical protein
MKIDEEAEKKNDVLKALSKAQAEIQLWKSKYETEALGRIDELEGGKAKLSSRVTEAEEHIEALNAKIGSAEKSKVSMLFIFTFCFVVLKFAQCVLIVRCAWKPSWRTWLWSTRGRMLPQS